MFDRPLVLLALWLLPFLALLLYLAQRRKRKLRRLLLSAAQAEKLLPQAGPLRTVGRPLLLLSGLAACIVAAAGPRFGVYYEEVPIHGNDIFVLLDVSRSMLAEDLPPNRLGRAKSDIHDLLERAQGDRVGLIAFAGKPIILVPLTNDHGFFMESLEKTDTNSAPRGGTAIGDAIRAAVNAFGDDEQRDRAIVLITDGEDHDSFPVDAAKDANAVGVKLVLIGLGDQNTGARIPTGEIDGRKTYLQSNGVDVWSKVDAALLTDMARQSGGTYIPVGTHAFDFARVYDDYLSRGVSGAGTPDGKRDGLVERRKVYGQHFQLFLALGLTFLFFYAYVHEYRVDEWRVEN